VLRDGHADAHTNFETTNGHPHAADEDTSIGDANDPAATTNLAANLASSTTGDDHADTHSDKRAYDSNEDVHSHKNPAASTRRSR
jgi:hypothetical protein